MAGKSWQDDDLVGAWAALLRLHAALVPDRTAPVVTYCTGTSCPNSRIAAEQLRTLGYTNVRAYEGGKQDWTEAGLPLESAAIA